eukprot:674598-Rhodomonas_salina.1
MNCRQCSVQVGNAVGIQPPGRAEYPENLKHRVPGNGADRGTRPTGRVPGAARPPESQPRIQVRVTVT